MASALRRRRVICCLLVALLSAALAPARAAGAAAASNLTFSLQTSPDIFPWWEGVCRAGDFLSAPDVNAFQNRCGGRVVIFDSVAVAEQTVPQIAAQITGIGYNPEHRPQTPSDEQADLAAAMCRFRNLADRYGLTASVGPDRSFSVTDGAKMAPCAGTFALQLQNFTNDSSAIQQFANPLIQSLRAANPTIRIQIQLRADISVTDLLTITRMLDVDGVSVIYQSSSLSVVQAFEMALRGQQPLRRRRAVGHPASGR